MAVPLELQPGEERVAELRVSPSGTYLLYLPTLGLWEIWRRRKRLIVTNRRVILMQGIMSNTQRSLPVDRIQDATVTRQFFWGSVRISTAGGASGVENFGPSKLESARSTAQSILSLLSQHRTDGLVTASAMSTADELTKLSALHSQGVLSDREFDEQKTRLLR